MKSPFRYAGSKQRLLGPIMERLSPLLKRGKTFHDVFVGGGSVMISVAESTDLPLFANDLDVRMSAFWDLMANGSDGDVERFQSLLYQTPSLEIFRVAADGPTDGVDRSELAYRAMYISRTGYTGGMKTGFRDSEAYPATCRFKPDKVMKSVGDLRKMLQGRLTVKALDFRDYWSNLCEDDVAYLDPPYWQKGPKLYTAQMGPSGPQDLSRLLQSAKFSWLLSYDDCPPIRELFSWARCEQVTVRHSRPGVVGKKVPRPPVPELLITKETLMDKKYQLLVQLIQAGIAPDVAIKAVEAVYAQIGTSNG